MTKILLFGGSGLLGHEIRAEFSQKKIDVVAPEHSEVDIQDRASLEQMILSEDPDMIINAAALINVNAIEADPISAWRINALAAGSIAEIIRDHKLLIPYILVSTSYVFDGSLPSYEEAAGLSPLNMYGKTKAHGERLVERFCSESDIPYYIVRTSWIYSSTRKTFVDEAAAELRSGHVYDASVDQFGNPTNARDFANTLAEEFIARKRKSGVYHAINAANTERGGVSRFDIATEIASIVGADTDLVKKTSSDAIFTAKRPSVILRNTKLPALRDWRVALREHLSSAEQRIH